METSLREQDKSHEGQVQALSSIRGEIQKDLKNIASETWKSNETSFLSLANEVFLKHKEVASVEVVAKAKAVGALITPIAEMLASLSATPLSPCNENRLRSMEEASMGAKF